ncbi:MAG: AAA family ATPase [Anaerolineaceae bacterium]|nr:AAA family ATPase [Anaerolineaceae bacterium]
MPPENRLMIHMLGQPRVFWGDQPLNIQRKLARIFIYYLACQKSMIGRSDLVVEFWPDSPNSRQHLRDLLSKLRAELPDPDIIRTDRDWIGLDYAKVNSDVLVFEDLYEQLSLPFLNIENRPLPEAIYQKMLNAIHMWEAPAFLYGTPLLDSNELNEWISKKNRKLRYKRLSLMMRISQHLIAKGDLESALTWLEMVNEDDDNYDFPQVIYNRLDVLYHLGRLSEAYEFGLLFTDQIKTNWFSEYRLAFETLMKRIENERIQNAIRIQPPARSTRGKNIPFVGRDDLMIQIHRAYRRDNIVVLSGETGFGKSRLSVEFINSLATPTPVFSMEAVYSERNFAFHAIIEHLRQTLNMSDWQKIEKFWISQLSFLMPELQSQLEHKSDLFNLVENQQLSLYEAFRQVLLTLAGKQKILISVENAQWLDKETIGLFSYLTHRHFFSEKAHLVLLLGNDELNVPVLNYLKDPAWVSQIAWFQIPPLDLDAISNIALYLLRKKLSEQQTQHLLDATGGNPLFVIETLQMILEKPDQLTELSWDQIPLSGVVQIVIRERLSYLSKNGRQVLDCAALVGTDFSFDYVEVMIDLQESALVSAFDELIDKGNIEIISQIHQPLRYKFKQTFIRDVVLQGLSQTHKQILHKRLADFLLTRIAEKKAADEFANLGYHLGRAGKIEQAFQYWIEAAELFNNADINQKANYAFEQAYLISQNLNFDITDEQLFKLWVGWGELANKMNDFKSATEYYHHAVEEGLYRSSSLLIGSGLSGEGYLFLMRGLPNQAKQYLEQAALHLKDGSVSEYIRNSIRIMLTHLYYFDLQACIREYDSIAWLENQMKTENDLLIFASLQSTLALTYTLSGKFKEAEIEANKSIQTALRLKNPTLRIENEFSLGLGYYYQGLYKKSLDKFGLVIQIAESNYYWRFVLETLSVINRVFFALGKTYQCLENIQNGYALAKVYQYTGMHSILINSEGRLYAAFGRYEKAISLFEESLKFSHNKRDVLLNQMWIGVSKTLMGELENGVKILQQVVKDVESQQLIQIQTESKARLGLALYLQGDIQEAIELLAEISTQSHQFGFAAAGTAYAFVRAQEALRKLEPEVAKEMAEVIMSKANQEESPWLEWHALEIMIAAEKLAGKSFKKYLSQKQLILRNLNQSKPQGLDLSLNSNSPPLFVLV